MMKNILNDNQKLALALELFNAGDINNAIKIAESYRPKGEWKQVSWKSPIAREIELLFHYKCDNCDKEVRIDRIERYNYCPHCGADMRCEE